MPSMEVELTAVCARRGFVLACWGTGREADTWLAGTAVAFKFLSTPTKGGALHAVPVIPYNMEEEVCVTIY